MQKNLKRFVPGKRQALDGKMWWCVWDMERMCWSTYICHGIYRTKADCQFYIDIGNDLFRAYDEVRAQGFSPARLGLL